MDKNLENRIKALEKWKEEKTRQQISFPLDINSYRVLNKYFLSQASPAIDVVASATGLEATYLVVRQDSKSYTISALPYLFSFVASTGTDELTVTNVLNPLDVPNFATDTPIRFETTGTLPSPLALGTTYYVKAPGGNVFDVATSPGGASINITTTGTGTHYIFAG